MNKNSHKIGLKKTNFSNPTGLTDVNNYSTAHELALLTSFCMRNHLLRSIFKKKNYICESRNDKMASIRYSSDNIGKFNGKTQISISLYFETVSV